MPTNQIRRMRHGCLAVALLVMAAGCGTDQTSLKSSKAPGAEPPGAAELDGVEGRIVAVGTAVAGSAIPVIALGDEAGPGAVWLVDTAHRRAEALPPLEDPGHFASASALATDDWVAVAAWLCPEPVILDDIGRACPTDDSHHVVLAYDRKEEAWTSFDLDKERGVPVLTSLVGSVATLTLFLDTTYTTKGTFELDLADPTATVSDLGRPPTDDRQCFQAQLPAMVFDSRDEPTEASVADGGEETIQRHPLPAGVVPSAAGFGGLYCFSAGSVLLTVGTPATDQPTGRITLSPMKMAILGGDGTVVLDRQGTPASLVAGGGLIGLLEADRFTTWSADGQEKESIGVTGTPMPRAAASGIVLFETASDESGYGDVLLGATFLA